MRAAVSIPVKICKFMHRYSHSIFMYVDVHVLPFAYIFMRTVMHMHCQTAPILMGDSMDIFIHRRYYPYGTARALRMHAI